ncbi:MAG: choice-of-anchor H family protein [Gammaproteobacteria bacterium]|nr:choice-of-anchor H family protein [Gammaproteobacteria bacterium]
MPVTAVLIVFATSNVSAQAAASDRADNTRLSVTTQMSRADRDRGHAGSVSQDEFPALAAQPDAGIGKNTAGQAKLSATVTQAPNTDFWFYSADVLLFNDNDDDGYYHGIDLLFDADTYYDFAEVYAVVYLSLEGGPWNEYAATENFTLSGASADDEYVVVTELVAGYPSGSYDLLIELFDTFDGSFVASYGPVDTSALAFLQLEDAERDAPQVSTTVIVTEQGGGGSLGWLGLLTLLIVARRAAARHWPVS